MHTKDKKALAYVVFGVYLLFLCWLILFKLADSVEKIPSMRGINLILFHYDRLSGTRFHQIEVFCNILAFVPAGYFFTAFGKGRVTSGIIGSAMLSLSFEILQWIFALGASDITDLIANTAGGALGVLVFFAAGKLFKDRQIMIASIIGAVLEALFVILMIALIILNN